MKRPARRVACARDHPSRAMLASPLEETADGARMSALPTAEPVCTDRPATPQLATIIDARPRDLGDLMVGRVLPSVVRRMVGPFIFFDHMGPADLPPGHGIDIRPHPHIGLATVTYLFEGELVHRDSLGSHQTIRPGDVNWMTAGRGIVHSERTAAERRRSGSRLNGLQLWVALPEAHEQTAPQFHHHPADTLPVVEVAGARARIIAGEAYGERSPVATFSPLFYADVFLGPGCEFALTDDYAERAAYVIDGHLRCEGEPAGPGRMLVFAKGASAVLRTESAARVAVLGGEPVGERHIEWNFVSSSPERIEQAKRDWREGRFPPVPGEAHECIPLPDPA
jgi:redox-sensitive bicupin YhaK (pirin superfamily)